MAIILAEGLRKSYGRDQILQDLTFRIGAGERVAVIGLNGAGKTTLFRCLLGLVDYQGTLAVEGSAVREAGPELRRRIGYVPQRPPLLSSNLEETVRFFSRLRRVSPERLEERLEGMGLSLKQHGSRSVTALSGGMLQKLLLALALAEDPPLLLLDEPTANLDPLARRDFLELLKGLEADKTVLLSSHRPDDLERLADRILLLHQGRIVFDGSLDTFWAESGSLTTLWVRFPGQTTDRARRLLAEEIGVERLIFNGTRYGIRVPRPERGHLLTSLQQAGLPVLDLWTEEPPLEEAIAPFLEER